jgi:hypothetical protein
MVSILNYKGVRGGKYAVRIKKEVVIFGYSLLRAKIYGGLNQKPYEQKSS